MPPATTDEDMETAALEIFMPVQLRQGSKTIQINATVDSGSYYSVLPAKYCKNEALQPTVTVITATNNSEILLTAELALTSFEMRVNADCLVSESIDEFLLRSSWLPLGLRELS
jgi:hypothetical protein